MSNDDELDDVVAPQKTKTTTKVVITTLIIGGILLVSCCGGLVAVSMWFFSSVQKSITQDPVKVEELGDSIASMDMPAEFRGQQGLDFGGFRMVTYVHSEDPRMVIMLMENGFVNDPNDPNERQRMADQMRQQSGFSPVSQGGATETLDVDINGETISFQVTSVNQNGQNQRQIIGFVPLKKGVVIVMVIVPEERYNEDELTKMLSTIREAGDSMDEPAVSLPMKAAEPVVRPESVPATTTEHGEPSQAEKPADPQDQNAVPNQSETPQSEPTREPNSDSTEKATDQPRNR